MTSISSFISTISPSASEISQVSTSWWNIRNTIQSKLNFVSSSKLTGSYIRRTKTTPINDLDIFFQLNGKKTRIDWKDREQKQCRVYVKSWDTANHPLLSYLVHDSVTWVYFVSPIKIMNQIKSQIQITYSQTPYIRRNWECVTVLLSSYWFTIDCVPYFWVTNESYQLIPTSWGDLYRKKTNPELDAEKINILNNGNNFDGRLKWVVKLMKYRNKKKNSWISFRSYVLECLVYEALRGKTYLTSYISMIQEAISHIYHKEYKVVIDIPGYAYIWFYMSDEQWMRVQNSLNGNHSAKAGGLILG